MLLSRDQVKASARHCHLTQEAVGVLFDREVLSVSRWLGQPGHFVSHQTVTVEIGTQKYKTTVLGPERKYTQVELTASEFIKARVDVPTRLRMSGDLAGSQGCRISGPCGSIELSEGVIMQQRHVHMNWHDAAELDLGVHDGEMAALHVVSPRSMVFSDLLVRINSNAALEVHLDTDEANACCLCDATQLVLRGPE